MPAIENKMTTPFPIPYPGKVIIIGLRVASFETRRYPCQCLPLIRAAGRRWR